MNKVDVVINAYGKPYQTLCTLKSLLEHSGQHIDVIYYIIEKTSLFGANMLPVINHFDNIISYKTTGDIINHCVDYNVETDRFNVRYQYGIEKSNKKHVFITHNDIMYTGDIIGAMLPQMNGYAGIGLVGQCWNCPANTAGLCNREKFESYNPTFQDVKQLLQKVSSPRTTIGHIFENQPAPLPECRINEFACIIDREITVKECRPNGETPFFGDGSYLDTASGWFHSLYRKGYKFKNFEIDDFSHHGALANGAGHPVEFDQQMYDMAEETARQYFNTHYTNK